MKKNEQQTSSSGTFTCVFDCIWVFYLLNILLVLFYKLTTIHIFVVLNYDARKSCEMSELSFGGRIFCKTDLI